MRENIAEIAKKVNDQGNDIYALQHPPANQGSRELLGGLSGRLESSMDRIARTNCAINGHMIGKIDYEKTIVSMSISGAHIQEPEVRHLDAGPTGMILCLRCGMMLEQIRGEK